MTSFEVTQLVRACARCPLPQIWGCTAERANEITHEFFKSPHFARGIPVVPGGGAG